MAKVSTQAVAKKKPTKQGKPAGATKKPAKPEGTRAKPARASSAAKPQKNPAARMPFGWDPATQSISEYCKDGFVSFVEAVDIATQIAAEHGPIPALWTHARIGALSDAEVLERLAALGISTDRTKYLAATARDTSAVPNAITPWTRALPKKTSPFDVDFVMLAAIDLWRRFRPERPCSEGVLARWIDAGRTEAEGDTLPALDLYLETGAMLWKALPDARDTDQINTFLSDPRHEASSLFQTISGLGSWAATRAADSTVRAAAYLETVVSRLTGLAAEERDSLEEDRAGMLLEAGHAEAAEPIGRAMIARNPGAGGGYVIVADSLSERKGATAAQIEDAIAHLRRAAKEASDAEIWDLPDRIKKLEKLRARRK